METWLFFLYTKGMNSLEILAPVGSPATLEAALQAGCDAIYCALPTFGARAYADNFTLEQMKEVVHRCHSLNVKVHVTMNTLLFEDEIEAAYQQAKQLYEIGVDALIVQDLGLIHLLHERLPQLCLHASTQLSITRPDQIEQCKKLGIQRVVLARECTKEQIQACIRTGIEVEVFVQGAICISYSGQCLFSSLVYGRSGNRGLCAQPCRMPYFLYKDGSKVDFPESYLLSPKDLSLIEEVQTLQKMGVCSVKIEGRMKNREYVYKSVELVKKARDGILLDLEDCKELKAAFNRGFTKGHFDQKRGRELMNMAAGNHQGISVGKILGQKKDRIEIGLTEVLRQNDGIRIVGAKEDFGCRVNYIYDASGKLVSHGLPGQKIMIPVLQKVKIGSMVLKTVDSHLQKQVEQIVQEKKRKLSVDCHLSCQGPGHPLVCQLFDGQVQVACESEIPAQPAKKRPLSQEDLVKQFSRTQDTFVQIDHFTFDLPKEIFFPLSVLNHLRKCAVDLLYQEKTKTGPVMEKEYHVDCVSLPLEGIQIQEGLSNTNPELADLRYNVTNSYALACLVKLGYKGAMVSLECSLEQTKALVEAFEKRYRSPAPVSVWIYGKRRLMLMNHCVVNTVCKDGKRQNCALCHRHRFTLKGKDGKMYRLMGDAKCHMGIFESEAFDAFDQIPEYRRMGIHHFHIFFLDEEPGKRAEICRRIGL